MDTPYPRLEEILGLVKDTHDGNVVLPEFQRSFVWGNQDIKDFLVSILNGYFTGTFLFLRRGDAFDFQIRYFEGVDKINTGLPKDPNERSVDKAVLDGQQRLTALFYVLYHPPDIEPKGASYPHRFFLKVHEKINGKDWDDVILSISENDSVRNIEIDLGEGLKKYSFKDILRKLGGYGNLLERSEFKDYCHNNGIIPCSSLKSDKEFNKWLDEYVGHFIKKGESYEKLTEKKESIRGLFTNWFGFKVPSLTLENKPFYEVAEIFERINRTGIELSVFALATAVFYKQKINLREWWKGYYQKEDCEVSKFCKEDDEVYPKYLLQTMALLQGKEVKKKILINPKDFSIDNIKWNDACKLLEHTLKRLQNTHTGYGVIQPDLLPYKPVIVSLAGLLNCCKSNNDFRKLDAWYWSSVFSGRYAGSSDTSIKQDFDQVKEWLNDDSKKPGVVKDAENIINEPNLREVDRGALYKAILNMIALKGAKDFFSGQSIQLIILNDHHIFPKKSGIELTNENSILNRTLISDETNNKIWKNKPSTYLLEMEGKLGSEDKVKDVLKTHLIDEKAFGAMRSDDYESFLSMREEFIKNEMKNRIQL